MKTSKPISWILCLAASVTIAVAFSGRWLAKLQR